MKTLEINKCPFPHWIQQMLPDHTESYFFKSSRGRLHYLKRGTGKQVLFIHGNPTWSFLWRKIIGELDPTKYEVIAPDLMNLGFSDNLNKKEFNLVNHVEVMNEFFRKIVKPGATLVVQDWGGPIGLLASQQAPSLFEKFVILNTALGAPKLPLKLSFFHRFSFMKIIPEIIFFCFKYPLFILDKVQSDQSTIKGKVARAYKYPIIGTKRLSSLWYARMVPNSETHPSYSQLQILESYIKSLKNVQIIWGVKDPILGKRIFQQEALLKNAKIFKFQVGHFLQEEIPAEIANVIKSFDN